jgi:diguanylate cyclase (GGDEF)-like protein
LRDARDAASLDDGLVIARRALAAAAGGSRRDHAAAGHTACFFLYRTGAIDEVIALGESVLPQLKGEALFEAYAEALRWVGLCACDAGRFGTAIAYATEGYRLADELNDQRGRILAFSLLGGCFERAGDPWQGERLLRDGLVLARELGESYPLLATLNNLAAILIGKFYSLRDGWAADEARAALNDSLPLAREVLRLAPALNDPYFDAFAHGNLGELLVHVGELDEADRLLTSALSMAIQGGYKAVSQRVRCSLGELHLARGQTTLAKQILDELLAEKDDPPPVSTQLRLHYALYLAHRSEGNPAAALESLEAFRRLESQRSMQQLKDKSELMVTRLEADENQRKVLERAYSVAQVHATRAVELERMALQDDLTGLGNRRALDLRLAEMVAVARNEDSPLVVVVLDLDHFKRVNDVFGHAVGDHVLSQVAKLLREQTRVEDFVTRTGGEEFVIVMPGIGGPDAFDLCERLRVRISDFQWRAIAHELSVTLSAGIACAPEYDAKRLVERADLAMYRAKRGGRNRVAVAP